MIRQQKIEWVDGLTYNELRIEIEKMINLNLDYEIQQIDYFNMKNGDSRACAAFILFRPK